MLKYRGVGLIKAGFIGVAGATIPYYICMLTLRGTDLQGKTVRAPVFRSEAGRCTEP